MDDEIILRLNPTLGTIKVETQSGGVISHKEITNEVLNECLQGSLRLPAFFSGLLPDERLRKERAEPKPEHLRAVRIAAEPQ